MPAMDFCNTMEFPITTLWNFNLQLSVFLSYNKQSVIPSIVAAAIALLTLLCTISTSGSMQNSGYFIIYMFFFCIIGPVFYGLIGMLFSASYNWLAKKHGGLEVTINEEEYDPEKKRINLEIEENIKLLQSLKEKGLLTEEEFEKKKAEISTASIK